MELTNKNGLDDNNKESRNEKGSLRTNNKRDLDHNKG